MFDKVAGGQRNLDSGTLRLTWIETNHTVPRTIETQSSLFRTWLHVVASKNDTLPITAPRHISLYVILKVAGENRSALFSIPKAMNMNNLESIVLMKIYDRLPRPIGEHSSQLRQRLEMIRQNVIDSAIFIEPLIGDENLSEMCHLCFHRMNHLVAQEDLESPSFRELVSGDPVILDLIEKSSKVIENINEELTDNASELVENINEDLIEKSSKVIENINEELADNASELVENINEKTEIIALKYCTQTALSMNDNDLLSSVESMVSGDERLASLNFASSTLKPKLAPTPKRDVHSVKDWALQVEGTPMILFNECGQEQEKLSLQEQINSLKSSFAATQNSLRATQAELGVNQNSLRATQAELSVTQNSLRATQAELSVTQNSLRATQTESSVFQNSLRTTQTQLAATQNSLRTVESDLTKMKEIYSQDQPLKALSVVTSLRQLIEKGRLVALKKQPSDTVSKLLGNAYRNASEMIHSEDQVAQQQAVLFTSRWRSSWCELYEFCYDQKPVFSLKLQLSSFTVQETQDMQNLLSIDEFHYFDSSTMPPADQDPLLFHSV